MPLPRKKLFAFGFAAIGINLMNLIVGTYLCDALLTAGFGANIETWTYLNKDIVIAGVWAVLVTVAKIIDGLIDIPLANFLDNMKSKFGKRKTGIVIGLIPLLLSFVMFTIPVFPNNLALSTVYFWFFLILFYCSYTCVMLAYYACFSEITNDDSSRQFLSNIKSVADVVYFVLGFALLPVLIGFINIRFIALAFAPLALLVLVCLHLLKGESVAPPDAAKIKNPGLIQSFAHTFKNKGFVRWLIVLFLMTFGIQMFLTGQNVYLSGTSQFFGWQISVVNACAFAPVPLTIALYGRIVKKKGFRFGFIYAMSVFALGMVVCTLANVNIIANATMRLLVGIAGALICSFGIGTFFSVSYSIPSHVAANEKEKTGYSQPSMYFAVQGLFTAVAAAISTGIVWVNMKKYGISFLMMAVVGVMLLISCAVSLFLPKSIAMFGKKTTTPENSPADTDAADAAADGESPAETK